MCLAKLAPSFDYRFSDDEGGLGLGHGLDLCGNTGRFGGVMFDFNLGFPELVTLAVLGVLIFGPDKLPELARKAGRVINYVRGIANNARAQIHQEMPELGELNLAELNPKNLAMSVLTDPNPSPVEANAAKPASQSSVQLAEAAPSDVGAAEAAGQAPVQPAEVVTADVADEPGIPAVQREETAPFDTEAT
ncbi:MAG: twin-arginine translocase TatA/TatE family subunit [Propionibacteriaceae bacterium]|jgi:sec-independent protein translocase protein TatB|nr:twin-arginine translocase TatA/TatE family subunit [Propionibacteriaceae bacterium]